MTTMAALWPWCCPGHRCVQPDLSVVDLHTGNVTSGLELQGRGHGAPVWQLSSWKRLNATQALVQPAKWGTMYWTNGATLHWRSAGIVCRRFWFHFSKQIRMSAWQRSNGHRSFCGVWSGPGRMLFNSVLHLWAGLKLCTNAETSV